MRHLISTLALALLLCASSATLLQAAEATEKKESLHDLMEAVGDDYKAVYKIVKKQDATQKAAAIKGARFPQKEL